MKPKDELILFPADGEGCHPYLCVSPEGEVTAGRATTDVSNAEEVVDLTALGGGRFEVRKVTRCTESGPAQVASEAYRRNWGQIFGSKAPVGQA